MSTHPKRRRGSGPAPWLKVHDGEAPTCWAPGCSSPVQAAWLRGGCGTFCGKHHRWYHRPRLYTPGVALQRSLKEWGLEAFHRADGLLAADRDREKERQKRPLEPAE